jgi:cysteinyl-tRNA synthetase
MAAINLYNSLTRKKEVFTPIAPPEVGIYACGPTVYQYQHIGNLRRYLGDDILRKFLIAGGFKVKYVMNVTDVGHLTSDADTGEDKLEKSARQEGKSAYEIAKFYEEDFFRQCGLLNIKLPDIICKATEHIKEQIEMIGQIEKNGFTYQTDDGIYFDTSKLADYGKLAGGKEGIKPGARVDVAGKRNPTDFALWKFSPKDSKRQMEWESPWGVGFPGWHIECSAMSRKYLGETFDIHTGGVDHIAIHHTNEIAQSEGATGKTPVNYWLHHEFLQVDGGKMAKSLGNTYTVEDVVKKGLEPLALRYLFLTAHYRDPLNFTWDNLEAAQTSLKNLRSQMLALKEQEKRSALSTEKNEKIESYRKEFTEALDDDLNTSKALAVFWEMLKSNIPSEDKYDLAITFDGILGLGLAEAKKPKVPEEIEKLAAQREKLRSEGKFEEADSLRKEIEEKGFILEDTSQGSKVKPQ